MRAELAQSHKSTYDELVATQTEARATLQAEINACRRDVAVAKQAHLAEEATFQSFCSSGRYTQQDFMNFALAGLKPGYDFYEEKYLKPTGRQYPIKQAFAACAVFDPLILSTLDIAVAKTLVDQLACFEFPEFVDAQFMNRLKDELSELKIHADLPFDWDTLDGAEHYNTLLARKNANTVSRDSREPSILSWKDDPSERARRIWLWWRGRLRAGSILPTFRHAIRIVVLVPPSSAAAERAFSQLKIILEVVGVQPLEDNVETRMLERINKKKFA
jgi:hypothetical protein